MKNLILIALLFVSYVASAQMKMDSIKCDCDTTKHQLVTSIGINTKNLWRGNVYGNNAPNIAATLALHLKNHFEIGATGTAPLSGKRDGYGIWMELYVAKTIKQFTVTFDDYYFFNAYDSLNDYLSWDKKNTQHLVEGRLRYDTKNGRFNITGSCVVYAASSSVNNLYFEAEYYLVPKMFSVSGGGVLGQSSLNFYDKGGVTHFGFTGYRDLVVSKELTVPVKLGLFVSPNYKNASKYPAFTQNPINIVAGFTF